MRLVSFGDDAAAASAVPTLLQLGGLTILGSLEHFVKVGHFDVSINELWQFCVSLYITAKEYAAHLHSRTAIVSAKAEIYCLGAKVFGDMQSGRVK